jgi:hypothetical protein
MVEERRHHDSAIANPTVRYERTDASFAWIVATAVAAGAVLAIVFLVAFGFFRAQRDKQARIEESPFPLAARAGEALPPPPRLEQIDRLETREHSPERGVLLDGYGPAAEKGYVHIPISRAMELLENKLPARQEPAGREERADGLLNAGASNSGRLFRGKPR